MFFTEKQQCFYSYQQQSISCRDVETIQSGGVGILYVRYPTPNVSWGGLLECSECCTSGVCCWQDITVWGRVKGGDWLYQYRGKLAGTNNGWETYIS